MQRRRWAGPGPTLSLALLSAMVLVACVGIGSVAIYPWPS